MWLAWSGCRTKFSQTSASGSKFNQNGIFVRLLCSTLSTTLHLVRMLWCTPKKESPYYRVSTAAATAANQYRLSRWTEVIAYKSYHFLHKLAPSATAAAAAAATITTTEGFCHHPLCHSHTSSSSHTGSSSLSLSASPPFPCLLSFCSLQ